MEPAVHTPRDTVTLRGGRWLACAALLAVGALRCHRAETYESVCQLVHAQVVETAPDGAPLQIDLELEWDPCPGDQFQMVRGGAAFARCIARYPVGALLPVHVVHWWDSRGYYTWDVDRVGVCDRVIEPASEGSYEKSQECHDTALHGRTNGFTCNRRPFADLVAACPWMARD